MKIYYLSVLLFIFITLGTTNTTKAQFCEGGTATETLDAANSNITLSSSGLWAFDLEGTTPAYEWPKTDSGEGPGVVFTGNLWFGGYDQGANLKVASKTYGQDENNGYWPGPYNYDPLVSDGEVCANWDRLFKVNRSEIESFQADFADNQQIDAPISTSILGWPARGNPSFNTVYGFELPIMNGGLAPFFDQNFDGIYDPMVGDYPLIKCADQAVWWVFNDAGNANDIGSQPLELEVQIMAYVYDSNVSNIYNSSFYDVKFINRGTESVDSMYAGIWMDPDLGCPYDDYLGSVPEENLAFVYNEDAIDGLADGTCEVVPTYEEPPMFGLKLLEGPYNSQGTGRLDMNSFVYYNNAGGPPTGSVGPTISTEIFNVLTGRKADGSVFLNPDNEPTNFLFPDNPADAPDGWSMCSEEIIAADRRFIMSMGPMTLPPGASNSMTFALVVQPQPTLPCPDVSALIAAADLPIPTNMIGSSYCNLTVGTNEEMITDLEFSVFPNPTSDQLTFQLSENEAFVAIQLFRIDGQLVRKEENLQSSKVTLSLEELATGTYIYQIQTQSGDSVSGKVILE